MMNSSQAGIAHIYGENSELLPASHNEDSLKSETTEIIKYIEYWIFGFLVLLPVWKPNVMMCV